MIKITALITAALLVLKLIGVGKLSWALVFTPVLAGIVLECLMVLIVIWLVGKA